MAHLLGSESCLESLGRDISDIQAVISDVMSRIGPLRYPSWKYPDKISSELNIGELLDIYCYSDDEDHCKLSHIILFELAIDRLVLLLQGTAQYVDQLLKSSNREQQLVSSRVMGPAISVGLVAKKFWNKVVHVQQSTQKMHFETKTKSETLTKMEDTISDLRDEIKMIKKVINKRGEGKVVSGNIKSRGKSATSSAKFILSPSESISFRSQSPTNDLTLSVEDVALAKTYQETSSQTYDTAFIPCEACSRTQKHLIEVGDMVMSLCESQGLTSSLAKQKKLLRKSLMAAADISRWTSEQNQDLARINSHLDNLYAQINPLEAKLKNSQESCKELEKEVQEMEQNLINEKNEGSKREETVRKECQQVVQGKEMLLVDSESANEELQQGKEMLQEMAAELNQTIKKQKETLSGLEEENCNLKTDLENESNEVKRLQKVDQEILNIKVELNEVQIKLRETSLELDKTQARNRSLVKHEQALQHKHDALLQRVDELDNECEDLRDRLLETEGERDDLQDSLNNKHDENTSLNKQLESKKELLERIQEEKITLIENVKELQESCDELQQQLQENEEKMKLLSEYPSMDTKITAADNMEDTNSRLVTDMDVMKDMERQVMSNNIRILMLEEQNEKLRKSITLLMSSAGGVDKNKPRGPVNLWKPQNSEEDRNSASREFSAAGCFVGTKQDFIKSTRRPTSKEQDSPSFTIQPRPPSKPRTDSAKSRQKSPNIKLIEKRHSSSLSTKLASSGNPMNRTHERVNPEWESYQLRNANPPEETRGEPSPSGYHPVDVFMCTGCDKIYHSQKDLDIHKSFCYGSITGMS